MVDTPAVADDGEVERPWDGCQFQCLSPPIVSARRNWEAKEVGVQLLLCQPAKRLDAE